MVKFADLPRISFAAGHRDIEAVGPQENLALMEPEDGQALVVVGLTLVVDADCSVAVFEGTVNQEGKRLFHADLKAGSGVSELYLPGLRLRENEQLSLYTSAGNAKVVVRGYSTRL